MKKMMLILALAILAFLAWAQYPVSLRHYALGSIMDGEWEQIYDPIDLSFYDQTYYFTNLADYVQQICLYGSDAEFVQESEFLSEYPFGFTFKNPWQEGLKHAFLIRFKDNKKPFLDSGYGEGEDITTTYFDSDGDLVYDIKDVLIERGRDYGDMSSRLLLLLNSTLPIGDNVFGFRLSYNGHKSSWDEAQMEVNTNEISPYLDGFGYGDYSFYEDFTHTSLEDNLQLLHYSEEGDFETNCGGSCFTALFSYMLPSDFYGGNAEMRYDLNLSLDNSQTEETTDSYEGKVHEYINETTSGTVSLEKDYEQSYRMPRNEVFLSARYRKNKDEAEPRYRQGFWEIGLGLGGFFGNRESEEKSTQDYMEMLLDTAYPDGRQLETGEYVWGSKQDGSYSGLHGRLGGRAGINFSDYVSFGFGLNLDLQTHKLKSDGEQTYYVVELDQAGTEFDDENDYKLTSRYEYKTKNEEAQTYLVTTLPVGLEFRMPHSAITDHDYFWLRNFCFRLGTVFCQQVKNVDSRSKLDELIVNQTITENGNGDASEGHYTDNTFINSKHNSSDSWGSKKYTMGLGYEHSDNLNIDLGGYIDSSGNEYYVGLMFTVKK